LTYTNLQKIQSTLTQPNNATVLEYSQRERSETPPSLHAYTQYILVYLLLKNSSTVLCL